MKNKTYLLLLITFLTTSCDKGTQQNYTDYPIIEAYLEPGDPFNVTISRQIPFVDDVIISADDIKYLSVRLEFNNQIHLLNSLGSGQYVDSTILVSEDDNYTIFFNYNDKKVSAYTYIPSKPVNLTQTDTEIYIDRFDTTGGPPIFGGSQPDPIEINWNNPDNSYYLILIENIESTLDPIVDFGDEDPPGNIFKKSPTNLSTEEITSREFQYYGTHRIILYHVLADYATLYDENSTSSQNISNPSTSIINGYGIFTGFSTDTLYVEVKEQ